MPVTNTGAKSFEAATEIGLGTNDKWCKSNWSPVDLIAGMSTAECRDRSVCTNVGSAESVPKV